MEVMKTNYKCRKCGHKWASRVEKPITCPKCKRYDYDKKETQLNKQEEEIK
jgi:predicted Zn-ribbon and HTH transcriptional regulator